MVPVKMLMEIDPLPMRGSLVMTIVGILGTGVPRLACLRPTAWLS